MSWAPYLSSSSFGWEFNFLVRCAKISTIFGRNGVVAFVYNIDERGSERVTEDVTD